VGRAAPPAPAPSVDELSVDAELRGVKVRAGVRGAGIVDESAAAPPPQNILIVDDVLTAGAHFVAIKRRLPALGSGSELT
jgi:predicted amidophosphoribosyltransferase